MRASFFDYFNRRILDANPLTDLLPGNCLDGLHVEFLIGYAKYLKPHSVHLEYTGHLESGYCVPMTEAVERIKVLESGVPVGLSLLGGVVNALCEGPGGTAWFVRFSPEPNDSSLGYFQPPHGFEAITRSFETSVLTRCNAMDGIPINLKDEELRWR